MLKKKLIIKISLFIVFIYIILFNKYSKQKNNIFIKAGIDIPNYEKALEIIKEQLNQMKNGDFTEEDINNAKIIIDSSVGSIPESQDSEITYYFSQEISDEISSLQSVGPRGGRGRQPGSERCRGLREGCIGAQIACADHQGQNDRIPLDGRSFD